MSPLSHENVVWLHRQQATFGVCVNADAALAGEGIDATNAYHTRVVSTERARCRGNATASTDGADFSAIKVLLCYLKPVLLLFLLLVVLFLITLLGRPTKSDALSFTAVLFFSFFSTQYSQQRRRGRPSNVYATLGPRSR